MPKKTPLWFRTRGYLHFDSPISYKKAQSIVTNINRVATHSFYPLIHYNIDSYKVFKDQQGKIERKEKNRPIAYASHIDSHIYGFYAYNLDMAYESQIKKLGLDENILAFRSLEKSNIEFANNAFEDIKSREVCTALALDIKGFFDNLDHLQLKNAWAKLLDKCQLPEDHYNIFKSLTRFSEVDRKALYEKLEIPTSNPKNGRNRACDISTFRTCVRGAGLIEVNRKGYGIPQGTPISALLSNIYMLEFDQWAKKAMDAVGGSYYRYCDDILFILKNEGEIESLAQKEIQKLELSINNEKTEKCNFWITGGTQTCDKPLQYLGFTFDGQRKLLRSAALARFSNRMKRGVRLAKATQKKQNEVKRSKGIPETALYKNKLYERYSHLGKRNFISYSHRAANYMESDAIKKQIKPLWSRLQEEMKE